MKSLTILAMTTALFGAPAMAQDTSYRIVEEPITLDVHFHFRDKYVYSNDWPVEKAAAEATGISLNGVASLATTSSQDAFNLMIASGDLPDIVGGDRLKDKFNLYGQQGAFLPLNDLIEEHAPNIKAFFDDNPRLLQAITAADGNLYYIPYIPDGVFGRGYFLRKDWLATLGLQEPETVEELYAVLTAFRNNDPNGNGVKDEIPFFARESDELLRLVTLWDARSSGSDTPHDFYVDDGELRHGYADENYRTAIANLAKWYREGLIDPEIFTRGARSREDLLSKNIGGMTHDWFASTATYNDSLADVVPGFDFAAILPPASPSGRRIEEHRRIAVKPDGWAISLSNEHPEETMEYFDFWFTDLGRRLSNFGVEGVHYDMVDGVPTYKPEILEATAPVNAQMWAIGAQLPKGFHQDYGYESQWTNQKALDGIALYEAGDYLVPDFLGVSLTEEEQAVYDRIWPSTLTYMREMQQAWILGSRDVEADWADYQSRLDRMGFKELMEVMNTAYVRQYGAE